MRSTVGPYARCTLALAAVCVLSLPWSVQAQAARSLQPRLASTTDTRPLTERLVLQVFTRTGLRLFDTGYGTLQPVVALAQLVPGHAWSLGVYIYRDPTLAAATFRAESASWRASGFTVKQIQNVVVTVVPKGRILGTRARPEPMPAQIAKALVLLARG